MSDGDEQSHEPPEEVVLDLEEALSLLAALEDACDALIDGRYLVPVVAVEAEIRMLAHRLGFDDPLGGWHG